MKKLILFITVAAFLETRGQMDSIPPRPPMQQGVTAFVEGYPYQSIIEKSFFTNDFNLALSDSSYKLVRYLVSWADTSGRIHAFPVTGSLMMANHPDHSLGELDALIAFEQIIITRDKKFYRVPAFVITLADRATAEKAREDLALCQAWIAGYKQQSTLSYTVFSKDVLLELSDPSYQLVDFDMVMEDEQEGETVKTRIKGGLVRIEKDEVTRLLKRLRPGDTILFENIRAEKDGNLYRVQPLTIYIK